MKGLVALTLNTFWQRDFFQLHTGPDHNVLPCLQQNAVLTHTIVHIVCFAIVCLYEFNMRESIASSCSLHWIVNLPDTLIELRSNFYGKWVG